MITLLDLAFALLLAVPTTGVPPPPLHTRAPFIETFHRGAKMLIYIAAVHHSSVTNPDAMRDPVFQMIQNVFAKASPDAVIVEGVAPSQISGFLNFAKQCAAANYNLPGRNCDEPEFAAYSATRIGVPVYTGEPSARTELASFEAHGYSLDDYLAFWIMNNIPQAKRHGKLTEDKFRQLVYRIVHHENHLLGTSARFTAEDFAAWYAKNMQNPPNYLDIVLEDTDPYPPPRESNTLLHTLAALCTKARDENVVATIKAVLQNHNRVLVVYGSGHLDFEWNRLVEMMGVPKMSKAF